MRDEVRHVFIADDGTEFDNKAECLEYEFDKGIQYAGQIFLYDENFNPVSPFRVSPDYVYYANILTLEASEWFEKWCDDYGSTSPWEEHTSKESVENRTGLFIYDADKEWICFETEMKRLRAIADKIKGGA